MSEPIRCASCGNEATRTGRRQYFCSGCRDSRRAMRRRERYANNVERERARDRAQYAKNPKLRQARWRKWAAANKEALKAKNLKWRKANPERVHEFTRRRLRNPSYRVHASIRSGVYASLNGKKRTAWAVAVGYTLADLMQHIERQFLPGMNWENHGRGAGKWHIDHIVPKNCFQFTSIDDLEFKACWALTNLRPLWQDDNLSKSAKRLHLL